jgi:hypothetical protein
VNGKGIVDFSAVHGGVIAGSAVALERLIYICGADRKKILPDRS